MLMLMLKLKKYWFGVFAIAAMIALMVMVVFVDFGVVGTLKRGGTPPVMVVVDALEETCVFEGTPDSYPFNAFGSDVTSKAYVCDPWMLVITVQLTSEDGGWRMDD